MNTEALEAALAETVTAELQLSQLRRIATELEGETGSALGGLPRSQRDRMLKIIVGDLQESQARRVAKLLEAFQAPIGESRPL